MNENLYNSEDEDIPSLSAGTFAALQEFYREQEIRETILSKVYAESNKDDITFEENWQLSQFWYDDSTVETIVQIVEKSFPKESRIALVSCPTLYKRIKEKFDYVKLFEYDDRFKVYGENFVFYDYKSPLDIPRTLGSSFDLVIADPPFLSEECLTKTSVTIKFLTKEKIILCTGSSMAELAIRLLNVKKSKFEPHHKNNLANEFWCYSNFDIDSVLL